MISYSFMTSNAIIGQQPPQTDSKLDFVAEPQTHVVS